MKKFTCALIVTAVAVGMARAERPPEFRKNADAQIVGTVKTLKAVKGKYGTDGELTTWTAEVVISKVVKGEDVKAGSTIQVKWFAVTKQPGKPFPGASGHKYAVKEKDTAEFWLMKRGKSKVWDVIYNKDGVEKVKSIIKPKK